MKVQIVITGQYRENYGSAADPYWKFKGAGSEVLADNVEQADVESMVEWAKTQFEKHSYSDTGSACSYDSVELYPAGMTGMDRIPFSYRGSFDEDVQHTSQAVIAAFRAAFPNG